LDRFTLSQLKGHKAIVWRSSLCLLSLLIVIPRGWVSAWAWEKDLRWFYILLIAFFVSSLLTPIASYISKRFSVLDIPTKRKMHDVPIPRLGGLAVYFGVLVTLVRNFVWTKELIGLLSGATLIYLMGVVEDVRGLSARTRLWGQIAASAIVIYSGICVSFFQHTSSMHLIDMLLTTVWLVGITNAINFLDGIDGLAVGMGTVCSLLFVLIAWPERQGQLAYAAAALAGACLGFIPYNWHKAKIFLGDAGATFIGFMLAGLAVMGSWASHHPIVDLSSPVLILGIPIFDMVYTTLSRIRRRDVRSFKQWLEYTGKDHFHHRLIHLGMTVRQAVWFILLVNLALGLNALNIRYTASLFGSLLLVSQAFVLFIIIVVLMLLGREITPQRR